MTSASIGLGSSLGYKTVMDARNCAVASSVTPYISHTLYSHAIHAGPGLIYGNIGKVMQPLLDEVKLTLVYKD